MVDLLGVVLALMGPPVMTGPVAVHAAYVIHTTTVDSQTCCGACTNGQITHGDGHKTPCPCPPDCECKAVKHPPVILKDCERCKK